MTYQKERNLEELISERNSIAAPRDQYLFNQNLTENERERLDGWDKAVKEQSRFRGTYWSSGT